MPAALKQKILLFLILAGAALALIAASLTRLELKPGVPLPYLGDGKFHFPAGPEKPPIEYDSNRFFINVLIFLLAAFLIWIIYQAIRGVEWKQLGKYLLRFVVIFVLSAGLLAIAFSLLPKTPPPVEEAIVVPTPPPVVTTPLGPPPPILVWLVGAGLAVGTALLAVGFFRSRRHPDAAALRLGQEAEKARQALLAGLSLREVILQCYREMSRVLQEEHDIERLAYMTTGEFERLLAAQGFPAGPVHQLTLLFDAVRYGRWQPGLSDDQKAIACLEAIVEYSRETQQEGSHE